MAALIWSTDGTRKTHVPGIRLLNSDLWRPAYANYRFFLLDTFGVCGVDTSHSCFGNGVGNRNRYSYLAVPQSSGYVCTRCGVAHDCVESSSADSHPCVYEVGGQEECGVTGKCVGLTRLSDDYRVNLDLEHSFGNAISSEQFNALEAIKAHSSGAQSNRPGLNRPGNQPRSTHSNHGSNPLKAAALQILTHAASKETASGSTNARSGPFTLTPSLSRKFYFARNSKDGFTHFIQGKIIQNVFEDRGLVADSPPPYSCKTPWAKEQDLIQCLAHDVVIADYFWDDFLVENGAWVCDPTDMYANPWSSAVAQFKELLDNINSTEERPSRQPDASNIVDSAAAGAAVSVSGPTRVSRAVQHISPRRELLTRLNTDISSINQTKQKYHETVLIRNIMCEGFPRQQTMLRKTIMFLAMLVNIPEFNNRTSVTVREWRRQYPFPGSVYAYEQTDALQPSGLHHRDEGLRWESSLLKLLESSEEEKKLSSQLNLSVNSIQGLVPRMLFAFSSDLGTGYEKKTSQTKQAVIAADHDVYAAYYYSNLCPLHPAAVQEWIYESELKEKELAVAAFSYLQMPTLQTIINHRRSFKITNAPTVVDRRTDLMGPPPPKRAKLSDPRQPEAGIKLLPLSSLTNTNANGKRSHLKSLGQLATSTTATTNAPPAADPNPEQESPEVQAHQKEEEAEEEELDLTTWDLFQT